MLEAKDAFRCMEGNIPVTFNTRRVSTISTIEKDTNDSYFYYDDNDNRYSSDDVNLTEKE